MYITKIAYTKFLIPKRYEFNRNAFNAMRETVIIYRICLLKMIVYNATYL